MPNEPESNNPLRVKRVVPNEDDQRWADQLVLLLIRDFANMGIKVNYIYTPEYIVQSFAIHRKYLEKGGE
jgi:hypothetical protein